MMGDGKMRRSSSMLSNLSAHTSSSFSSTQLSSSESLQLADFAFEQSDDDGAAMGMTALSVLQPRLPLAPVPRSPDEGDDDGSPLPPDVPLRLDLLCEDGVLGQGTTGAVRISSCGRVAWKVMTPSNASAPLPSDAAPADLHHPHLVSIIERRLEGGVLFEARELCLGGELFDEIVEGDMLSTGRLPQALRWFAQAASAVAHAHAVGATHGQLRPEHVLLSDADATHAPEPAVRLSGFEHPVWREYKHGSLESVSPVLTAAPSPAASVGAHGGAVSPASSASAAPSDSSHVTPPPSPSRRLVLHRPDWPHGAPELRGARSATVAETAAADVWTLGVFLTCMLTGAPPTVQAAHKRPATAPPECGATVAHADVAEHGAHSGARTALSVHLPPGMTAAPPAAVELVRAILQPDPRERPSAASVKAQADALLMPPPTLPIGAPRSGAVQRFGLPAWPLGNPGQPPHAR